MKHCQKLKSLKLVDVRYNRSPAAPQWRHHHQLPCLEDLRITQLDELDEEQSTPTTAELVFLLLSSSALVTLELEGLHGVNDQVLERVARHHGFSQLKNLRISWSENAEDAEESAQEIGA